MEEKIICPKCSSNNKELYMTHGQIIGHRWICKDCGKVFKDNKTRTTEKKTMKVLLIIVAILTVAILLLMAMTA